MLVVGLGNPGQKYSQTRHNFGFMLADFLLDYYIRKNMRVDELSSSKFKGISYKIFLQNEKIPFFYILKPQTFMNLSGESVQPFMAWHNIVPDNLLVLHDELDISFGDVRLKTGGGLAGHNGLKSIAQQLGTQDFHRLRLGIGRPEDKNEMLNFVLAPFSQQEKEKLPEIMDSSLEKIFKFINKKDNEKTKTARIQMPTDFNSKLVLKGKTV